MNPVPADDPAPLIDAIRFYLREPDRDPYARQRATAERREQATREVLGRLDPVRKALVLRALRWAQRMAPVREDALGEVGLAWPQMRWMLAEIGNRLVADGVVEQPDDVYWLRRDELSAALAAGEDGTEPRRDCRRRSRSASRSGGAGGGSLPRSCCPNAGGTG